jgi:hypothetical protein
VVFVFDDFFWYELAGNSWNLAILQSFCGMTVVCSSFLKKKLNRHGGNCTRKLLAKTLYLVSGCPSFPTEPAMPFAQK